MNTVQDAFRTFFPQYAAAHNLCAQQRKAAQAIINCHTEAMGANVGICEECGHSETHYNSCRNRHCPSCQGIDKDVWADERKEDAINAPYFHVVFTIPEQLQMLMYQNKEILYGLMYRATSETISDLTESKKYLGAQTGFFSVLHTWGQDLRYHPHIHIVLVGGGLTKAGQWVNSSKKFFIPVRVLSKKFRGKFLAHLKSLYYGRKLEFFGEMRYLEDGGAFESFFGGLYKTGWYSYTKRSFSGASAVVKYLSRYTHRIAIANSRIVSVGDDTVTFKVRDNKDANCSNQVTLGASEFIRRFLMHVLPKGFVKIRYYGVLAVVNRKTKLVLCQKLTNTEVYVSTLKGLKTVEVLLALFGRDVTLCPKCKRGKLVPLQKTGAVP